MEFSYNDFDALSSLEALRIPSRVGAAVDDALDATPEPSQLGPMRWQHRGMVVSKERAAQMYLRDVGVETANILFTDRHMHDGLQASYVRAAFVRGWARGTTIKTASVEAFLSVAEAIIDNPNRPRSIPEQLKAGAVKELRALRMAWRESQLRVKDVIARVMDVVARTSEGAKKLARQAASSARSAGRGRTR
jgi:hypothetical protein